MKLLKRIISILLTMLLILAAIFALGRYGWKLLGFRGCEGAGIESVEVGESTEKSKDFTPVPSRRASADTMPKNRTGHSM